MMRRQKIVQTFNERCSEYDSWFSNNLLFEIELAALQSVQTPLPSPKLEIGIGPGHFATHLQVDIGIDPAISPLALSKKKGITVICSTGEKLPIMPDIF